MDGERKLFCESGLLRMSSYKTREEARCALNFFARRSATRESTRTGGEMSANAERNSENPTEHLAAKYN